MQHCLLSKMVYLNVNYAIATQSYEFVLYYAHNRIENITLSRVIIVTPAIRIRQRPGHPGSPGVLSANGSLHFGRYSEACNGRGERFLCQLQIYFRSYYSGFYHYVLAFSNDLPTPYIARPTPKRRFAGDWV